MSSRLGRFGMTTVVLASLGGLAGVSAQSKLPWSGAAVDVPAGKGWWSPGESRTFAPLTTYATSGGGRVATFNASGPVDTRNHPFFAAIGANGRACVSCHQPQDGMSLSVATVRERWAQTAGKDPIFDASDGSNCPNLPQGEAASHSLLLEHGLFRVTRAWPPKAADGTPIRPEFKVEVVRDPTGCNTSDIYGLASKDPTISVFRRPRVAGNLRYVETSFSSWSPKIGRTLTRWPGSDKPISDNLLADGNMLTIEDQSNAAANAHLKILKAMSQQDIARLASFLRQLYVAQDRDPLAGSLTLPGAARPVLALAGGKSDVLGPLPLGRYAAFPELAPLLSKKAVGQTDWTPLWPRDNYPDDRIGSASETPAQRAMRDSIARGYDLFVNRQLLISNVANYSNIGVGNPNNQTCANCHNRQRIGDDNAPGYIDLGVMNFPTADEQAYLPLFKITCEPSAPPHPYLGRVIYTRDPGRALVSGKCLDVGSITMQSMRALASRAPYFASGAAKDLGAVVDYYDRRFNMRLTARDRQDLVNFMRAL